MSNRAAQQSPTAISPITHRAGVEVAGGDITLRELPWCGKINIRGAGGKTPAAGGRPNKNSAPDFMRGASEALGILLPTRANTTAADADVKVADVKVFWLAHDEWLVHCPLARADEYQTRLRERLAGVHYAVTEVTDYYTILELAGRGAEAILARGCPLDLHPQVFATGQCAQSKFGNAAVLLHKPTDDCFHIQVRWSFTEYVWDYLTRVLNTPR